MSNVYRLSDYMFKDEWEEIFHRDDGYTELHIYLNRRTCEVEIFQIADGEGRRSCLSMVDSVALIETLKSAMKKTVDR